jgi:hypothetical protein
MSMVEYSLSGMIRLKDCPESMQLVRKFNELTKTLGTTNYVTGTGMSSLVFNVEVSGYMTPGTSLAIRDALDEFSPYVLEGSHFVSTYEGETTNIFIGKNPRQRILAESQYSLDVIRSLTPRLTFQDAQEASNHIYRERVHDYVERLKAKKNRRAVACCPAKKKR